MASDGKDVPIVLGGRVQPVVTLFCAFARDTFTKKWLDDLSTFKHDPSRTRVVILIDGDFIQTSSRLKQYFETHKYLSYGISMNHEYNPNDAKIAVRRARIAFIKNQSKYLIKKRPSDYVVGLEDDTAFGGMDIMDLLNPMMQIEQVRFVQGLQCGRWGVKYLGAWQTDNPNDPQRLWSITPQFGDKFLRYQDIDGGGFYYYATPTDLYCKHEYQWSGEQWGPDVNYGLWLRQQGYVCFADTRLVVGHRTYDETIYPDGTITRVEYYKDNDEWKRIDTEQASTYERPRE